MKNLKKKIGKEKVTIAALHLLPTKGFAGFTSRSDVVNALRSDLNAVQEVGFDSVIIENNYDLPHKIILEPHTVLFIREVIAEVLDEIKVPFGLSILWNDYKTAFSLGKDLGADFIRIPVFVDKVKTDFGIVEPIAEEAIAYRKKIGAENIEIFADVHVKHAEILNKETIAESGENAMRLGADGLIVTGRWTADSPNLEDMRALTDFPLIIGSGATTENIKQLMQYADSVIVGTSLKAGANSRSERNVKSFQQRVDKKLAEDFLCSI